MTTRRTGAARRAMCSAGAAVLLLTAAGCGARWTDEQRAEVLARHEGGTTAGTAPTEPAPGDGTDDTGGGAAAELPCTAPSDETGVTDDTITVGAISSLSGPVPGLGETADAATRAYVAYRNATGGVCGRQIELEAVDDGTDNGRYRAIVGEMGDQVLGIAGGLGAGDAGGADVVEQQGLPVVTTAVSEEMEKAATTFDLNPPFEDVHQPTGKYDWLYDEGARKVALVWINVEQATAEIGRQRAQMEASGLEVVHESALPLSTLSYDSAARGVANSGADYLFFTHAVGASASMARSMDGIEHDVRFEEYLNVYGSDFAELAGAAADGASTWIRTLPTEERAANPELDAFLEWTQRVAPDATPDSYAAHAWAGAKAFFDALEALPGPISRQALLDQLRGVETYDAGGTLGPIRLGAKRSNGCSIGVRLEGGTWKRMAPDQGFLC